MTQTVQKIILPVLVILLTSCQTPNKNPQSSETHGGRKILTLNNKTRGGTTRGVPVKYDKKFSPFFKKISQAKTKKEKDRLAILSQTGEFQVHFEFVETINFDKKKFLPYYSWSTEYIFPIKNEENFISLQHLLVMKMQGSDKAHVVKHWRQDWTYEDPVILEYQGHQTWSKKKLQDSQVKGQWSQAVFQVDDSPRYQTYGTWVHAPNISYWISAETNRPLPRRESSVRSDYQVLRGINRIIVTPKAWYHEQHNLKAVVDSKRSFEPKANHEQNHPKAVSETSSDGFRVKQYLSREIGLNRYERIRDFDFSEGKKYWEKTKDYWKEVRLKWDDLIKSKNTLKLKTKMYGKKLYETHFEFAQKLIDGQKTFSPEEMAEQAKSTINHFISK